MEASTFCVRDFGTKRWKQVSSVEGIWELSGGSNHLLWKGFWKQGVEVSNFCGRDFKTKGWKQVPSVEGILEIRHGSKYLLWKGFWN